jgi:Flp pilus assembly protein CpaB
MKIKTLLLLVVAVVCGTAGSRISKRLFSSTPEPEAEMVVVLAAKHPLASGTLLSEPERLFEERKLAKSEVPDQAVQRAQQLRGRKLAKAIAAQALVTVDCLTEEEIQEWNPSKKEGRQAIEIPVRALGSIFFWPQARVDVIWTANATRSESRLIARDVQLLSLQTVRQGRVIATVGVKHEDAEKLKQAATQGSLKLVLRSNQPQMNTDERR